MGQDNIWERELRFPVDFVPVYDTDPSFHRPYTGLLNTEVEEFLHGLDVEVLHYERFFLSPETIPKLELHIDGFDEVLTKLNFVYCAAPSYVKWYEQIEDRPLPIKYTDVRSMYRAPDPDNCKLVHTLEITSAAPRLLNTALIHEVLSVSVPRYCFSFALGRRSTKAKLTWDTALDIFKDYIV